MGYDTRKYNRRTYRVSLHKPNKDILPFLGEELKIRLDNFIQRLYQNIHEVAQDLIAEVERHRETGIQKKDYVAKLKQVDTDPLVMPLMFKIFDKGAEADVPREIIKIVLKAINLGKVQFEQARTLFAKSIKFDY